MLLNIDNILEIVSSIANLYTLSNIIGIGSESSKKISQIPLIRVVFIYSFAYSIFSNKTTSLIATLIFFIVEVKDFIQSTSDKVVDTTKNIIEEF